MKRITTILALSVVAVSLIFAGLVSARGPEHAIGQGMGHGMGKGMEHGMGKGMGHGMGKGMLQCRGPVFTEEQREQIKKISDGFEDERVELQNRARVLHMELCDSISEDEPDFRAIESRIEDAAEVRVAMMKMRLHQHVEIRKILTPDQRVLFDRGLRARMGSMRGEGRGWGPSISSGPHRMRGHWGMGRSQRHPR